MFNTYDYSTELHSLLKSSGQLFIFFTNVIKQTKTRSKLRPNIVTDISIQTQALILTVGAPDHTGMSDTSFQGFYNSVMFG